MELYAKLISKIPKKIGAEQLFMLTILFVNAGNYVYNLLLGRFLGPEAFSDAAILITLLLILSFVGMTFQIVTAKYAVLFENSELLAFIRLISGYAVVLGFLFGAGIIIFYQELQVVFHTQTAVMFFIFRHCSGLQFV